MKIIEARLAIVLKPADPIELAEVLFRLVAFYPSGETDARIAKMRAEDFADILSSLPLWVIRDVCRDYKANMISRSGDRQAFCPTAGEIRQECERRIGYLRLQAREVQNVRNAVITPPYGKR